MPMKRKLIESIGRFLKCSPSTILNEIARDFGCESGYTASLALAGEQATFCEIKFRRTLKLVVGYQPFEMVTERLKNGHLRKLQIRLKVYTQPSNVL